MRDNEASFITQIIPLISSHRFPLCPFRQLFFSYHSWIAVHESPTRGGGGGGGGGHGKYDGGGEHALL